MIEQDALISICKILGLAGTCKILQDTLASSGVIWVSKLEGQNLKIKER